ncbi:MAG: tetratricopeptide repeat protein [Bacteroidales bacterium]|nr:tetratricopeptide repeat protein [Bacteroidales bacterium]
MKKFFQENLKNIWFWLYVIVAFGLLIAMPVMSLTAGDSGDEDGFQVPQGKNIVNYFKTDGEDTTCMSFENLKYYGCSFDVIAQVIHDKIGGDDLSKTRHICNSLLGWLAILVVGLIAYQFAGFRAGVITMLLLFLSPRFLGHSFNNPKDLPFATAIITAIFGMVLFFKQFPKVKWYTYLILILSIAYSISIRIGGLILFGFFGLFGFLFLIKYFADQKRELTLNHKKKISVSDYISGKVILKMLVLGLGISIIGYFLGLLLWPFAMQDPIKNPIESFKLMSTFNVSLRQLFEGSLTWSDMLPWYYTPKYILMTVPITILIGVLLFFLLCWKKRENRYWAFLIFFTFFFPIFWIVYTKANVYGGWRHAMFAYPPMVVAAGWGIDRLIGWLEEKFTGKNVEAENIEGKSNSKKLAINILSIIILLGSLYGPIRHIVVNHPYEYVYFNKFVGGVQGAYGQYEMDYYYHSTREASEWIIANAEPNADGSKIKVGTWHLSSVVHYFRNDTSRFAPTFIRWYEKGNSDWDYAIFTVTGMQPDQITNAQAFPPKNCIHTIDVDGKPICLILKRDNKDDLKGYQYRQQNNLDSALYFLTKAIQENPYNESVLSNLYELYLAINQQDSAKKYIDQALSFLPKDDIANYYLAQYYTIKNQWDDAEKTYKKIIANNPISTQAYYLLSNLYLRKQDLKSAENTLNKLIELGRIEPNAANTLLQIYKFQGLSDMDAYKKLYKKIGDSLVKLGKEEEAQQYIDAYEKLKHNIQF